MKRAPKSIGSLKPIKGGKSPGIGYLYVLFIMGISIMVGMLMSGGFIPVDPNGPGGPPTLEPYFDSRDYGQQNIILPTGPDAGAQQNLQLKTFSVNTCGQRSAIYFVIDVSGSMGEDGKMNKAKEALRQFTNNLGGKAVIGITTFSAEVKDNVKLNHYKAVKQEVTKTIDGLEPDRWTSTRDAFQRAKMNLVDAITQNKFPDYKYSVILLTDGVPEVPERNGAERKCLTPPGNTIPDLPRQPYRCFALEQDPRVPSNLAADIKTLGVDIYSIGIFSNKGSDVPMKPYLETLLRDVASTPTDKHYYSSIAGNNLQTIFENIINTVCSPENQL